MRDGTAEPVQRDQILRHERGQGKNIFPVQLNTSRIGNLTRLILTLAICDDHTIPYILRYCSITILLYRPPIQSFCVAHVYYIPIVDVGKERRTNWSMVIPAEVAPVTGIALRTTGPEQADPRQ